MSVLEQALLNIESLSAKSIVALRTLWGITVTAYAPSGTKTVYGTDDSNKMSYSATPTYTGQELITGIYSQRFSSDATLDPYTSDEPKIYTVGTSPILKDYKVVVSYGARTLTFRVSKIQEIHGRSDSMVSVLFLVPR